MIGMTGSHLGFLQSICLCAMVLGAFLSGKILRMRHLIITIIGSMLALSGLILAGGVYTYIPAFIVHGITYGIITPYINYTGQMLIRDEYRASLKSLVSSLSSVVLCLLQIILGALIDRCSFIALLPVIAFNGCVMMYALYCLHHG